MGDLQFIKDFLKQKSKKKKTKEKKKVKEEGLKIQKSKEKTKPKEQPEDNFYVGQKKKPKHWSDNLPKPKPGDRDDGSWYDDVGGLTQRRRNNGWEPVGDNRENLTK